MLPKMSRVIQALVFFALAPICSAASFQIQEQAVSGLGLAYSGTAASSEDASTSFYNPAGMINLAKPQMVLSSSYIYADTTLHIDSRTNTAGASLTGGVTAKPQGSALVPGLFIAGAVSDKLSFGVYSVSPFGLITKYGVDSPARFLGTRSSLRVIDVGPSIGYKLSDSISIGVSIGGRHVNAELDGAGNVGAGEGFENNYGRGSSIYYNAGIIFTSPKGTRLGVTYRSNVEISAYGTSTSFLPGVSPFKRVELYTKVILPESVVFSVHKEFDSKWSVSTDLHWTRWSRFDNVRLEFRDFANDLALGGRIIEYNYKNTYRLAIGTKYQFNERIILKFGYAFDESPTRDEFRTVRIPDSNRNWLAIGAKYKLNKNINLDIGYSYIFFASAPLSDSAPIAIAPTSQSSQTLSGNFDTSAHVMGIQLTWNFV